MSISQLNAAHAVDGDLRTCWSLAEQAAVQVGTPEPMPEPGAGPASDWRPVPHLQAPTELTRRQVDHGRLGILTMMATPAKAEDRCFLRDEADVVLHDWIVGDDALDGRWFILLPAAVLHRFAVGEGARIRDWLADAWPEDAADFVERWNIAHPAATLAWPDSGDDRSEAERQARMDDARNDRAMMNAILRKAWPMSGLWHEPPRNFTVDELVYDMQSNKIWDIVWLMEVPLQAVDTFVRKENWPRILKKGKAVAVPPSVWVRNSARTRPVNSRVSMPGQPRLVKGWVATATTVEQSAGTLSLNLWRDPPWLRRNPDGSFVIKTPAGASARRFFRLLKIVVPDRKMRRWTFRWFAYLVRNLDQLPQTMLWLSGNQGIGKDALVFALCLIVGFDNVAVLSPDQVTDKNNSFLRRKLCIVSEMRASFVEGGARGLYAKFKEFTTSPPDIATIIEKYEKAVAIRKRAGWIATTNELTEGYIPDDGERRIGVAHSDAPASWHLAEEPDFFRRYFDGLDMGDALAVRDALFACDMTAYRPADPPPATEAKRMAIPRRCHRTMPSPGRSTRCSGARRSTAPGRRRRPARRACSASRPRKSPRSRPTRSWRMLSKTSTTCRPS